MLIGFIGIFIFSLTLPATKIAILDFDPYFVAYGRAGLAGLAAIAYLIASKANWVEVKYIPKLLVIALGVVFGFPILVNLAMQNGSSAHGSIILGLLPLATAILGAIRQNEKPSIGFWISAFIGSTLVVIFSFITGGGEVAHDDWLLFGACLFASIGYSEGADLSKVMNPKVVISWVLVLSLPINLIMSYLTFDTNFLQLSLKSSIAFLYLAFFSMYIGFFFWYEGLTIGGVARVSQVQLLQPFCTMIAASFFLGDELTVFNLVFATLVVLTVMIGKKMLIIKKN
jgi:drug/metabolite transporter (DMT)-like permease